MYVLNRADPKPDAWTIAVAYCDLVLVDVMPFEVIRAATPSRESPYTSDPAITGVTGPLIGSTITVTGNNFANTRFSSVSMQLDGASDDTEWQLLNYTYVSPEELHVHMPRMDYTGDAIEVVLRVTNGGTVYPGINYQTFAFTYEYSMGEDWAHELHGFYTFDTLSYNATAHTWENLVNRSDVPSRAVRSANYGMGGPFQTQDRNSFLSRALVFTMGERLELPPFHPVWSACVWIYAREGSETLLYEHDAKNHATRNVLMVHPEGELSLDGTKTGAKMRLEAWQFLCVSRGSTEATIYVSGKPRGSAAVVPASAHVMAHAMLGKMLIGMVDDLWVWGRELHEHEVASMYKHDRRGIRLSGSINSYFSIETTAGVFNSAALAAGANFSFAMEAWVQPRDTSGSQPILQIPVPASTSANVQVKSAISHGICVCLVGRRVLALLPVGDDGTGATGWGSAITANEVMTAGEWAQISVVYTTLKKLKIYVNGLTQPVYAATQGTDYLFGSFTPNTAGSVSDFRPPGNTAFSGDVYRSSTSPITVGYAASMTDDAITNTASFRGSIGEVRLWNRGVNDTDVASAFTCTPHPSDAGLMALFMMNEGLGSELWNHVTGVTAIIKYSGPKIPFWDYAFYGDAANVTVWPYSELSGASTKLSTAGQAGSFTFQDRAVCRRLKKTGGDDIQIALVGPLDRHTSVVFGTCDDHDDGTYTCSYNVTMCGYYALRLEERVVNMQPGVYSSWGSTSLPVLGVQGSEQGWLRTTNNDGSMAKGTPAKLYVHPGPTWAPKSYVWEDSDWLSASDFEEAHKGVPASFLLQANDYWGCPRTLGGDLWEVKTYGRLYDYGVEWEQEGRVVDHGDGKYTLSYTPHVTGRTHLSVMLNGEHVDTDAEADPHALCSWSLASDTHGSPWCVDVVPGRGSIEFDGLNHATAPHSDRLSLGEVWSVDVWVYPRDRHDATGRIFSKQSATSSKGYWMGFVEGGNTEIGLYVGSDTFRTLKSRHEVQPGQWTHLAAVYTGDTLKLYVNGRLTDTETFEHSTEVRENNQPLVIGKGFVGKVDELRLFKEDISSRLTSLWKCPAEPLSLNAYFSFNDGPNATSAHDYFGLEAVLWGYNATNGSSVDSDFHPTWSDMHAPSDYGVVDFAASVAKSFTGEGLKHAVAGIPTTFNFRFWDKCGFDYVSGDARVYASMLTDTYTNDEHDPIEYPLENLTVVAELQSAVTVAECTNTSHFQAFYTAPTCGVMRLAVELDGTVVDGFPMEIDVSPHPAVSAAQSDVVGLNDAVSGLETAFTIVAKDMFGCQRTSGGDIFDVQLTRTTLGPNPDGMAFAGPDIVTLTLAPEDHGDGTYTVRYTVPAAGNYTVFVGLRDADGTRSYLQGEDNQPLRFMATPPPWRSVHVEGDQPDPRYRATTVKNDDYIFVFRGWSEDKEGLMDVWRYPLAKQESAWMYRVAVEIENPPSYPIRIMVDTETLIAEGKMRADCGDAMFKSKADSGWADMAVPYMIDSHHTCGMATTIFWLTPPSGHMYLFYGNPGQRAAQLTPSDVFLSWDDFETPADGHSGLPRGWSFAKTCSMPSGDPATFSISDAIASNISAPIAALNGNGALQVDVITRVGGALLKDMAGSYEQYILRAAFYDSDAVNSGHWISPNYDDCSPVDNAKLMLDQASGIGVFTPSIENSYTSLYPWRTVGSHRTAGWHMLEMISDGEHVHFYVDDMLRLSRPAAGPMDKIFIRGGGPDPDVPLESIAAWDDIMAARYSKDTSVMLGEETAVLYTNKGYTRVSNIRGTPPPPRTAAAAAVYDNKVYLMGGYGTYGTYANQGVTRGATGKTDSDDLVWTYDLVTRKYSTETTWGSQRPSPRFEHSVAVHESSATIYLFGGRSATTGELLSDMWAYSIEDAAWTDVSPPYGPSGRFSSTATCYKHIVLVFGGLVNNAGGSELDASPTQQLWAFNIRTGDWSDLTPKRSPPARFSHAAAMQGGQMYIYGGYDSSKLLADAWKYDIGELLFRSPLRCRSACSADAIDA